MKRFRNATERIVSNLRFDLVKLTTHFHKRSISNGMKDNLLELVDNRVLVGRCRDFRIVIFFLFLL